jgi:hypothetical protein
MSAMAELDRTSETQRVMPACPPLAAYNVDTKLVVEVQIHAGGRCHEAANLLNCYQLAGAAYARHVTDRDYRAARQAMEILAQSECALRRFLFQSRHPRAAAR